MNARPQYINSNPEMAATIADNGVFGAIENEVEHDKEAQAMKWNYTYHLSDSVVGQVTSPFNIVIEQGTDFKCLWITGRMFSYDAVNATDFPVPNSLGATAWAGSGLSMNMVDTRSGRTLTSGYIQMEDLITPGYGLNFQQPYPFRYLWRRNSKIQIDIRNRDNADRTHYFSIALNGYKIATPGN